MQWYPHDHDRAGGDAGAGLRAAIRAGEPPQPSAEVRDAQRRLHALGFYNGPIDGKWGPDTRAAVEAFQRSRRLPATAELDSSTRRAMRNTEAAAPVTLTDPTNVRTVQNRLR